MEAPQEQVVMTPKCKTANSTTLIIERRAVKNTNEKMHVAGGEHTGIIINKETTNGKIVIFFKLKKYYKQYSRKWLLVSCSALFRV